MRLKRLGRGPKRHKTEREIARSFLFRHGLVNYT